MLVHTLHDHYGYSYTKIADWLGASSDKVVMHINRVVRYRLANEPEVRAVLDELMEQIGKEVAV